MAGLVWTVAAGAFPVFYRLMGNRAKMQFVVTGIAERSHISDRLKLVGVFLLQLMTESTVLGGHRTMYKLVFAHLRVAFGGNAGSLFQGKALGGRHARHTCHHSTEQGHHHHHHCYPLPEPSRPTQICIKHIPSLSWSNQHLDIIILKLTLRAMHHAVTNQHTGFLSGHRRQVLDRVVAVF